MKDVKKIIISLISAGLIGFIWFYLCLPAINIQSFGFWIWLFVMLGMYSFTNVLLSIDRRGMVKEVDKSTIISFWTCLLWER